MGVAGSQAPPLPPPGTPTALPRRTWKVATSSPQLFQPPLMRWVTACCCSGALKPRVISFAGFSSAASGPSWLSTVHSPLQRHRLLRSDCGVRQCLPDVSPRPEQLVLRALLRCGSDLPFPPLPPGLPQLDPESFPHDGRGRHPRRRTALCHPRRNGGKHSV